MRREPDNDADTTGAETPTPETAPLIETETATEEVPTPVRIVNEQDYSHYIEAGKDLIDLPEIQGPLQDLSFRFIRGKTPRTRLDYQELCLIAGLVAEHFQSSR